jgi:GT2 family glycosyltransferase
MEYSRSQLAAVIYRQQQLAKRQARLLWPIEIACRLGLQPIRGEWQGWHSLLRKVRRRAFRAGQQLRAWLIKRQAASTPSWKVRSGGVQPATAPPIKRVAVGLLTYNNEPEQLRSCLRSLDEAVRQVADHCHVEVLILDNGSSSEPHLAAWKEIKRLQPIGNVGFGAGHNQLMHQGFARGAEAYVAMNPDGRAHPRMLKALLSCSARWGHAALIEAQQFPCEHPKPYVAANGITPWASGACLLIPKQIYASLGGFDDTFFMYCEDVDLSWRARAAGFQVVMEPRALFLHQVTNRANSLKSHALMLAAGVQLGRKWRCPQFSLEATLRLRKLGAIAEGLPAQTRAQPEPVPKRDRWASTFGNAFSFSRPRW